MTITEEQTKQMRGILHDHIDYNCIFRANPWTKYFEETPVGKILSKNHKTYYTYQFFLNRLTTKPRMMAMVAALFWEDIKDRILNDPNYHSFQFAGLTNSSVPIISAMQQFCLVQGIEVNAFYVLPERKNYGLFNIVEGMPTEAPVILFDDTVNSGKSVEKVYNVCTRELGLTVLRSLYTIVTLRSGMHSVQMENDLIELVSLFNKSDFDVKFDKSKYWYPEDCQLSENKLPGYV